MTAIIGAYTSEGETAHSQCYDCKYRHDDCEYSCGMYKEKPEKIVQEKFSCVYYFKQGRINIKA